MTSSPWGLGVKQLSRNQVLGDIMKPRLRLGLYFIRFPRDGSAVIQLRGPKAPYSFHCSLIRVQIILSAVYAREYTFRGKSWLGSRIRRQRKKTFESREVRKIFFEDMSWIILIVLNTPLVRKIGRSSFEDVETRRNIPNKFCPEINCLNK